MLGDNRQKQYFAEKPLILRAKAGENEAFDRLFMQHKDGVYACLWHLLGDPDQVEDAVGNAFLSAFRSLGRFRGESSFATWLYRIAINEARARIRQKRRWKLFGWRSLEEPEIEEAAVDRGDDPAEQMIRAQEEIILRKAVRALPEPYRTPIILRYMSGMDSPEIAGILKRPAGTIRYQLSRGLQILRERLGSEWIR
jgi:RNA polymerase sigma-70 factor (ECF subfamily)